MEVDIKFKLWIEIKELEYPRKTKEDEERDWIVSFCVHSAHIYDEEFFIEGYPVNSYTENGKTFKSQTFNFNKKLLEKIHKLLLPGIKPNYVSMPKKEAWDYYHYTLYEGFTFNVHPISMTPTFFRQEFVGTQGEIYQKCLDMNKKWVSRHFRNKKKKNVNS